MVPGEQQGAQGRKDEHLGRGAAYMVSEQCTPRLCSMLSDSLPFADAVSPLSHTWRKRLGLSFTCDCPGPSQGILAPHSQPCELKTTNHVSEYQRGLVPRGAT